MRKEFLGNIQVIPRRNNVKPKYIVMFPCVCRLENPERYIKSKTHKHSVCRSFIEIPLPARCDGPLYEEM